MTHSINKLGGPQLDETSDENNIKAKLTPYGKIIKDLCTIKCKTILENQFAEQKVRNDTKMSSCTSIKDYCTYEKYLNSSKHNANTLIKFRESHYLPIEIGRYKKPKIPGELRLYQFCKSHIGNEFHTLMGCQNNDLKSLRDEFLQGMAKTSSQLIFFR